MASRTRRKRSHIPDFRGIVREVRSVANESLFAAVVSYADGRREDFIDKIETQAFASFQEVLYPESGTNLSPGWLARKENAGRDLRTMIATGWYTRNIKVFTRRARRRGERTLVKVGLHPRTLARDLDGRITDVPLWLVATYNEHGSLDGHLPARPHWGPYFSTMRANARVTRRRVREQVIKALTRHPKLKGQIVVQ